MTEHRMSLDEMKACVENWGDLEALAVVGRAFYKRNHRDPTQAEHQAMLPVARALAASGSMWLQ